MTKKSLGRELIQYAKKGKSKQIWELLDLGAEINYKDKTGTTPLMYALQTVHFSTVKLMIRKGANIRSRNRNQVTPVMIAAATGDVEKIKYLLNKGVDPNFKDILGNSAIIYAAEGKKEKALNYLIRRQVNINNKNNDKISPLMFAITSDISDENIILMIEQGAKINDFDKNNITPLMLASMNNRPIVLKHLLSKGARISVKNKNGWNAMKFATEGNLKHIQKILQIR